MKECKVVRTTNYNPFPIQSAPITSMEVESSVLGTYTVVFKDAAIDHAYGDALCEALRADNRVERASYYSDYDSQKIELVLAFHATDMKVILKEAVLHVLGCLNGLLQEM